MKSGDYINNTNPYGKPPKDSAEAKLEKLIVVSVENYCPCHQTITLRHRDSYHWVYLFVRLVPNVNFGDIVLGPCDQDGLFIEGDYYLYYNQKLRYRLQYDDFPPGLMQKIIDESAAQMYPGEDCPE